MTKDDRRLDSNVPKLSELFRADLSLPRAQGSISYDGELRTLPLVYTVFDGDQQQLSGLMKRAILESGCVPVNPPSILGYRDVVLHNGSKNGVLRDDLALLNRVDEVWLFSSGNTKGLGDRPFAEGMLVELLFSVMSKPSQKIFYVDLDALLKGQLLKEDVSSEVKALLEKLPGPLLHELEECIAEFYEEKPQVRYYNIDPLDFKYGEWLRMGENRKDFVPVIPSLAIEISDLSSVMNLETLCMAWLNLARLADQCVTVRGLHEQEVASHWQRVSLEVLKVSSKTSSHLVSWADFNVPKALLIDRWPISSQEADVVLRTYERRQKSLGVVNA